MNVALVDVDGHNFPNLALMKLSSFYKKRGASVEWYSPLFSQPDKIYASKVFTFTTDYTDYAPNHPEPVRGGTGYDPSEKLPEAVEHMSPDYSLYPNWQPAIGFLTRGCIRNCPWCIVPRKEGKLCEVDDIERVSVGRKEVVLLDNNFLAADPDFVREQLEKIARLKLRIDFNQGLDARLVTQENAKLLSACSWIRFIRFSCDTVAMIEPIRRAVSLIRESGCKREIFCYMLVQDIADAEMRLRALVDLNVTPFAQPYRDFTVDSVPAAEQKLFASFVNVKGGKLCNKMSFFEYKNTTCYNKKKDGKR